jgi:hypothetical protein
MRGIDRPSPDVLCREFPSQANPLRSMSNQQLRRQTIQTRRRNSLQAGPCAHLTRRARPSRGGDNHPASYDAVAVIVWVALVIGRLRLDLHGHCSSRETRFLALTSGTRNQHHIGFGKHLSCLGGEEHRVMLLLAFRANEPRPLNRSVVAMSMHLRR